MIATSIFSSVHVFLCRKNTFVVKINISIQFVTNLTKGETALILKTVRSMLNLSYVFLRYILIYNLEVSFNFHITFLQLRFFPYFQLFTSSSRLLELPITRTFSICLEGSSYRELSVYKVSILQI